MQYERKEVPVFYKDTDNKVRPLLVDPWWLNMLIEVLTCDENAGMVVKAAPGLKFVDPIFLVEMARVLAFGALKYGADNWRHAPVEEAGTIYSEAMLRHVMQHLKGNMHSNDDLYHLAQVAVNAMFLFYFERYKRN